MSAPVKRATLADLMRTEGKAELIGERVGGSKLEFTPPDEGENRDWVLVLDDADAGFAAPGTRARSGVQ